MRTLFLSLLPLSASAQTLTPAAAPGFNVGYMIIFAIMVIAVGGFVIYRTRKPTTDPTWATDPAGKTIEELTRIRDQAAAALHAKEAPPPPPPPPTSTAWPLNPANWPTPITTAPPPDVFVDRDDMMKWLGASGFSFAVRLDGVAVHAGFGPAVDYYTQSAGGVSRQQPEVKP